MSDRKYKVKRIVLTLKGNDKLTDFMMYFRPVLDI